MTSKSGRDNIEALTKSLEQQIPGFSVSIGGEELQRARGALAGNRGLNFDLVARNPKATVYTSAATKAIETAHALAAALEKQAALELDERRQSAAAAAAREHVDAIGKHNLRHPLQLSLPPLKTTFDNPSDLSDTQASNGHVEPQAATAAAITPAAQPAMGADGAGTPESATANEPHRGMPSALATPVRSGTAVDAQFHTTDPENVVAQSLQQDDPPSNQRQDSWWDKLGQAPMQDVINFFTDSGVGVDSAVTSILKDGEKEKDIRVRELALAALKYTKVQRHHAADYDIEYNHGLVLQELATHVTQSDRRKSLLLEACSRYQAAARCSPESYAAPYNWAVALGDAANIIQRDDPEAARDFLRQASHRYAQSAALAPNNPQTLNNWGLVLQELGLQLPPSQRRIVTQQAASKFRMAIRNRPDYDRCCYNMGTVYYRYATQLQQEHAQRTRDLQQYAVSAVSSKSPDELAAQVSNEEEEVSGSWLVQIREQKEEAERLTRYAASYVCLASSLQPLKPTYKQALAILQKLLPDGGVMSGELLTTHRSTHTKAWRSATFVLNHEQLHSLPDSNSSEPLAAKGGYIAGLTPGIAAPIGVPDTPPAATNDIMAVDISDITQVLPCMDPSLPDGFSFWVCLHSRPEGIYFVANHQEDAEVWVDAITLVAHISQAIGHGSLYDRVQ